VELAFTDETGEWLYKESNKSDLLVGMSERIKGDLAFFCQGSEDVYVSSEVYLIEILAYSGPFGHAVFPSKGGKETEALDVWGSINVGGVRSEGRCQ